MRTRTEESANYHSVFIDGKTLRFQIDPDRPITELRFPEFYDVGINTWCGGRCSYCYTDAKAAGVHFPQIAAKIQQFFGAMNLNERPYQVALGGSGEATAHPEFTAALQAFREFDIIPNYTTNGMHLSDPVLDATIEYCGGVAVSCHPHLERHWRDAIRKLCQLKIKLNLHVVVSDRESIQQLTALFQEYQPLVDYFVILPYMTAGRAANRPIDFQALEAWVDSVQDFGNIAFGSNLFEFLGDKARWDLSLYPPEIMSKYLIMDDGLSLYNNSFQMKRVHRP